MRDALKWTFGWNTSSILTVWKETPIAQKMKNQHGNPHQSPQLVGKKSWYQQATWASSKRKSTSGPGQKIFPVYPPGNQHIPYQGTFEDDFHLPILGYVSFLEGGTALVASLEIANNTQMMKIIQTHDTGAIKHVPVRPSEVFPCVHL